MTAVAVPATAAPARPAVRRTGPSLFALVVLEVRKSISTRSGRFLTAAGALVAPAAMALAAAASKDAVGDVTGPLAIAGLLTGYVLISLGVLSTAGEWTHRSIQTTYLVVPQRGRVLAAKVAAVALLGAVLAVVAALLSAGVLALFAHGAVWSEFGRALVIVVAAGMVLAVTGAGVGAALANTPAALTGLYLVVLGVMPILESFKPAIAHVVDPANAVLNLAQGHSQTASILTLAGWVVISVVAGAVLTHRRAVQ
jgi:hypothetical protein